MSCMQDCQACNLTATGLSSRLISDNSGMGDKCMLWEDTVTLSKRSTVLSMAAPSVDSRALPPASPSVAEQSSVSSAAAGPCSAEVL